MADDLDTIRLKDVTELAPEDKTVLNENWESLTTEEKDYFGTVYTRIKTDDEGFKLPFKSQEEFDKHIDDLVGKREEARKQQEEEDKRKATQPPEDKLFPDGYKAKDWNEAFTTVMPKLEERFIKKIENMNQERRDQFAKINTEFDKEFDVIASKDTNVPRKGTQEREDWEADVAAVGSKFHQGNMTDAYEIWKAMNVNKPSPEATPANLPTEGRPATNLVSKVGRGYGTGGSPTKTIYKVGGGRRLDDILDQRMREEGIEPQ